MKFSADKKVMGKWLPHEQRGVSRGQGYWPKEESPGMGEGLNLGWGSLSLRAQALSIERKGGDKENERVQKRKDQSETGKGRDEAMGSKLWCEGTGWGKGVSEDDNKQTSVKARKKILILQRE